MHIAFYIDHCMILLPVSSTIEGHEFLQHYLRMVCVLYYYTVINFIMYNDVLDGKMMILHFTFHIQT